MKEYGEPTWLRIPPKLKAKIWKLAREENRQLGPQIVVLLERVPELQEEQQPAPQSAKAGKSK